MYKLNQREKVLLHNLFSSEILSEVVNRFSNTSLKEYEALYSRLLGMDTKGIQLVLYVDGAADLKSEQAGIGGIFYLKGREKEGELYHFTRNIGKATNNEAEYEALIEGLKVGKELKGMQINVFSDSELLVKQINLEYKVKNPRIRKLYKEACRLLGSYDSWSVEHIGREKNKKADILSKQALNEEQEIQE